MTITWEQVGSPGYATKIAACSEGDGRIYALNTDRSLWVNQAGGSDSGWRYVVTDGYVQQILCAGNQLYVVNDDRSLWRNDGTDSAVNWVYVGRPAAAKQVTAATSVALFLPYSVFYALNDDNMLWRSTSGRDDDWQYVGTIKDTVRIAAGGGLSEARPFAVNNDGSLWLNAGDGCNAYWHQITDLGILTIVNGKYYLLPLDLKGAEITAASEFTLFALRKDHTLWRGTLGGSEYLTSVRSDGKAQHCDGTTLVTNQCGDRGETPCAGIVCSGTDQPTTKRDGTIVCAAACATEVGAPCCSGLNPCDYYHGTNSCTPSADWPQGECHWVPPSPPPPPPPHRPGADADPSWCGQTGQVCCHHKKACESDAVGSMCKKENDGNFYCTYPPRGGGKQSCAGDGQPTQVSYCAECGSVNYALFGMFCSADDAKKLAEALYPDCTIADGGKDSVCPR